MYVKHVKINNFRALYSADIWLQPGLNILIGPNNIGKSTILSAIDLVLNPNIQWWRRDILSELDFFRGKTDQPIDIEVLIGCGRERCVDEDDKCPRLEIITEDKSQLCRLAERTVSWDNKNQKFLRVDEVEGAEEIENVIRLKMTASFAKAEGYVETDHLILNEDGNEWTALSNPMKEWIGARFLPSNRDPMAECRLQYNSLLSKAVGDFKTWRIRCANEFREALTPIVKELSESRATEIINLIDRTTKDIGRIHEEETVLSLGDVRSHDIVRQIELCRRGSNGEEKEKKEWEIPFSRQGRGLQNVASLVLGIQSQNATLLSGFSIIMLEEPEQNLEPQMQRSTVKSVRTLCGSEAQIIMATHSPYVLSSIIDLKGVQRLAKLHEGKLTCVDLGTVSANGWDFLQLRKRVPHDIELLEALFSSLVVIWEGDSEAGLYPTLMRELADYPSEWLSGVNAGDAGLDRACSWFNKAGYETVVVLDGDSPGTLSSLSAEGISFLALSLGKRLEHIISDALLGMEEGNAARILLLGIGFSGRINWRNEFPSIWPALTELFKEKGLERKALPTDTATAEIAAIASRTGNSQLPNDIHRVLALKKSRRAYETIASCLHKEGAVPGICTNILEALKEIWNDERPHGQYQFDDSGNIQSYTI
jgi:putative ATP-dependent endonuclease of OLD family